MKNKLFNQALKEFIRVFICFLLGCFVGFLIGETIIFIYRRYIGG